MRWDRKDGSRPILVISGKTRDGELPGLPGEDISPVLVSAKPVLPRRRQELRLGVRLQRVVWHDDRREKRDDDEYDDDEQREIEQLLSQHGAPGPGQPP